jgi:hypothetical protein
MSHALSFAFLLLDGLPVAAAIYGTFGTYFVEEETTFDESIGALGPGYLLKILTIGDSIERGNGAMNLLGDFAYYKARWGAEIAPTRTLQLFRVGSPAWAKARAGEIRRRLFKEGTRQIEADHNLEKRDSEDEEGSAPASGIDGRAEGAAQAARIRADLGSGGVRYRVLSGAELRARLPFT